MRLSQHLDISNMNTDMSQDQQRLAPPTQGFWSGFKPRLTYAVALGLALVFALPIAYDTLTTETFVTKATDFQTVQLPDGSTITLNAGSQIKYKKDFNTDHRSLTLSGEAYFDVQKGKVASKPLLYQAVMVVQLERYAPKSVVVYRLVYSFSFFSGF